MFGYVLPVKSELKVRELERFRAVYCGLCQEIRRQYGVYHTLFLSYDMTFLALILSACASEDPGEEAMRCAVRGFRSQNIVCPSDPLRIVVQESVLLVKHKLLDNAQDEEGLKKMGAVLLSQLGTGAFRAAAESIPEFDRTASSCMKDLAAFEAEQVPSIDRPADAFARLTQAMIPEMESPDSTRILRHMFYHLGRWIYLIDAVHDLKEDMDQGRYNPIAARFGLKEPDIMPIREEIQLTLERSLIDIHGAFQLLKIYRDSGLIENIIDLGLPLVTKQVLDGTFDRNGGHNKHGSL